MKSMNMEKALGEWGEERACQELKNKGHIILNRNFKIRSGEIDIISKVDNLIVMTEVKTRASDYLSSPGNTVGRGKQRKIIDVANHYIQERDIDMEVRFDIVTIIKNSVTCQVEHLEGAFYPC